MSDNSRASQVVSEVLVSNGSNARATQVVNEVLTAVNDPASRARASQVVSEVLTQGGNSRASQVVLEVLEIVNTVPPGQFLPLFPSTALAGYSVHKKPTFASIVQSPPSGREVTGSQQVYPLWEFELPFEILRDQSQNGAFFAPTLGYTDLQVFLSFWLSRIGQFGSFIYQDLDDCSRIGQVIGTGDGVATAFTMVRQWGSGALGLVEPVGIVDVRNTPTQTLSIYLDGVLQTQAFNWWIDTDLRTLRFLEAPGSGVAITADFSYFFFCRFIEDALDMSEFMTGRWENKGLKFRSARPNPVNTISSYTIADQNIELTTAQ